jgi:hypothetical protein
LLSPAPTAKACEELAAKATFAPYSKHKKHPSAYKLRPYEGEDEDVTYCDKDAKFTPEDIGRAEGLLTRISHVIRCIEA